MSLPDTCPTPVDAEALLRDGQLPVLRYLAARGATPGEAAELAQETLVRAFGALARGDRPRWPIPWLLGIARHVLLEALRTQRYQRQLRERLVHRLGPEWQSPWRTGWPERLEHRLVVGDAVDALPGHLREAVVLHYFGELSVAEVARHLAITPGAVKTRLWRARQMLRAQLEGVADMTPMSATSISLLPDVAARTRSLALHSPLYGSLEVALHVGGQRFPVDPLSARAFPEGEGLSLDDLQFAVERLHAVRLAGDPPLAAGLGLWAAPDPFEHPHPAAAWSLLRRAEVGQEGFHATEESRLIPTDGWRLGTDPDWPRLLQDLQRVGVRHVWFTFLGLEPTHDQLCKRAGTFAAIVSALERCAAVGLATGANIVVSTRNTGEIAELAGRIRALGAEPFVPTYVQGWTPLGVAYECIRPEPADLVGLPPAGLDVNWGYREFWANPEAHAEGMLTRAVIEAAPAVALDLGKDEPEEGTLDLFVDATLDLWAGSLLAPPMWRVANLRRDTPEAVHGKLVALAWPPRPPSDAELAQRYGHPEGRQVHMGRLSLRRKWVAAWRAEHHVPWLPSF